ncbi:MAG TPA: FAD-binding domain-containing protein [Gaiellaceae bacterium]
MKTAVVLFTRDLRVHDNPALAAAHRDAERVVHLFVRDPAIRAPARRVAFLERLLAGVPGLVVEHGDPVEAVARRSPDVVHCSEDASPYARRRERRLAERFDLRLHPGTTVVPLGDLRPYRVFTPYFRRWVEQPRRALEEPPVDAPETEARRALAAWLESPAKLGSRLSPYLHFGALSALECVVRGAHKPEWVREIAWRDFYAQLLATEPGRFRLGRAASGDPRFAAWREGRTGVALVDAGMRQLHEEGWMPNRVRMVCAQYLVHTCGLDWRLGAAHFEELLVDADVASNRGNWLWVVANTRRLFNPELQAKRLAGYVDRWSNAGRPSMDALFRSTT